MDISITTLLREPDGKLTPKHTLRNQHRHDFTKLKLELFRNMPDKYCTVIYIGVTTEISTVEQFLIKPA